MADQPCTNTLDNTKFHVAVRLIQLFQNGKKPVDLALNVSSMEGGGGGSGGSGIMKPPYFEGVEVPQPQQQPQQQQQLQQQQQGLQPSSSPQRSPAVPSQQQPTIGMMVVPPLPLPAAATTTTTNATNINTNTTTTTTLAIQDPYTMTPQELSRYDALFPMYATKEDTADGKMYVSGATAVELFCKSGKFIWLFFSGGGGGGRGGCGLSKHIYLCSYANKL